MQTLRKVMQTLRKVMQMLRKVMQTRRKVMQMLRKLRPASITKSPNAERGRSRSAFSYREHGFDVDYWN